MTDDRKILDTGTLILFLQPFIELYKYFIFNSYGNQFQASQMTQQVKNPPAMQEPQEMQIRSVGWKDPLE